MLNCLQDNTRFKPLVRESMEGSASVAAPNQYLIPSAYDTGLDSSDSFFEYSVRDKDTLAGIALRHDMTLGDIIKVNRLSSKAVWPGEKLKVRRPKNSVSVLHSSVDNSLPSIATPVNNSKTLPLTSLSPFSENSIDRSYEAKVSSSCDDVESSTIPNKTTNIYSEHVA